MALSVCAKVSKFCFCRSCALISQCELYNPATNLWENGPDLLRGRFNFIMAMILNRNNPDPDNMVPAILGYGTDTEFLDPDTFSWAQGDELIDRNWV